MLLITCPYCGPRPEIEFRYGGEAHIARPANAADLTDEQWAEFLFYRSNPMGRHAERWNHQHGCQRWFNAIRDTVTDKFETTDKSSEVALPSPVKGEGGSKGPARVHREDTREVATKGTSGSRAGTPTPFTDEGTR